MCECSYNMLQETHDNEIIRSIISCTSSCSLLEYWNNHCFFQLSGTFLVLKMCCRSRLTYKEAAQLAVSFKNRDGMHSCRPTCLKNIYLIKKVNNHALGRLFKYSSLQLMCACVTLHGHDRTRIHCNVVVCVVRTLYTSSCAEEWLFLAE